MFRDEARGGDEHAARAARGVEDAPVVGLGDFGEEADDAERGVELAAFLALGAGELAEEVFVDAPLCGRPHKGAYVNMSIMWTCG
jgi:hypothetical protein